MRYFITSDVHGHYHVLKESLNNAGYDATNDNHHLLVLGDLFDRGDESKEVYQFLYELHQNEKATILLGNHDGFLLDFLEGDFERARFNMVRNGFQDTIESFINEPVSLDASFESYRQKINEDYPNLLPWLQSFPLYLEIDDYIFVHGGIDGSKDNWKDSDRFEFVWNYEVKLPKVPNKTVIAGHHRVATIRHPECDDFQALHMTDPKAFDPLYMDGKILIDRFVEISKELNVIELKL